MNEAALEAVRREGTVITSADIYNAMDRILQVRATACMYDMYLLRYTYSSMPACNNLAVLFSVAVPVQCAVAAHGLARDLMTACSDVNAKHCCQQQCLQVMRHVTDDILSLQHAPPTCSAVAMPHILPAVKLADTRQLHTQASLLLILKPTFATCLSSSPPSLSSSPYLCKQQRSFSQLHCAGCAAATFGRLPGSQKMFCSA